MAASLSDRFNNASQAYCLSRRNTTILLTVTFSFIVVLFLASFGTGVGFPDVGGLSYFGGGGHDEPIVHGCKEHHASANLALWDEAQKKYEDLRDDKFT